MIANMFLTATGAYLGSRWTSEPGIGAALGAVVGYVVGEKAGFNVVDVPTELPTLPPQDEAPAAQNGLGFFSDPKAYYTVWDGAKYLPYKYMTEGAAFDWYYNVLLSGWGKVVKKYIYKDKKWVLTRDSSKW